MTTLDNARGLSGGRRVSVLATVFGAIAGWNDARVTRRALDRLSDHELDDIGLSRGEIDGVADRLSR